MSRVTRRTRKARLAAGTSTMGTGGAGWLLIMLFVVGLVLQLTHLPASVKIGYWLALSCGAAGTNTEKPSNP